MRNPKVKQIEKRYLELLNKRASTPTPPPLTTDVPESGMSDAPVECPWVVSETLSEEDIQETIALLCSSYQGIRYTHKKRGSTYEVTGFSLLCGDVDEYVVHYVPIDADGHPVSSIPYTRAAQHFFDGRFEQVDV